MSTSPGTADTELLGILTKAEILDTLGHYGVSLDGSRTRSKASILEQLSTFPAACQEQLELQASNKHSDRQSMLVARRKRNADLQKTACAAKRLRQDSPHPPPDNKFLSLPMPDEVKACHKAFLDATSNAALKTNVCVCCARRLPVSTGCVETLDAIPNSHHLIPSVPHFAHVLTNGRLLVTEFLQREGETISGFFCYACTRALVANRLPPLALANRMWIGPVPDELSSLTVPERSLISKYHPRCFVYKLHPRDLWTQDGSDAHLQTGLVGNVTTYALNLPDVVKMVSGKLLPHPLAILSSTITVTMIGPGEIPLNWLKKTFRVRREAVLAAILCLKFTTRHPAYAEMEISQSLLDELPVDDIPLDIRASIRREPNPNIAQQEAESYLHNEVAGDAAHPTTASDELNGSMACNPGRVETAPDVIPLQYLGTMDVNLSSVTAEEMMMHTLVNLSSSSNQEGGYAVRHGRTPVNEFGRGRTQSESSAPPSSDNLSINLFPWLYPFGEGGIEDEQPVPVSMAEHVRCNILEWSRRFCLDPVYMFVFFAILQKRQAMIGASLSVKRQDFQRAAALFSTLTLGDLSLAADEFSRGQPPSNPNIALLRRMIHSAGGKVMGSDASRAAYRSEIASVSLSLNPPSLWMTINPTDLHDPLVQVFAGESIDMDHFNSMLGPDSQQQARNLAQNPYAAATFFNFLITTMFETLFGIRVHDRRITSDIGVLGYVSGYYGVVEAQGRGSLHLHALLWLVDTPSSDDMQALLKSPEFRDRLRRYVDFTIRAHPDELTAESTRTRPREPELAWSRPPDPTTDDYEQRLHDLEVRLARSQQLHACKRNTCLTVLDPKTRTYRCKRKAPFPLSDTTAILEDGTVLPKRTHGYLNNWNPHVLVYGRCNNDLKFFSNGAEARKARWYITGYATKSQRRTNNLSALLAKRLAYHFDDPNLISDITKRNQILVFQCLHSINRQMEQSGQQVINLLMNYGDRLCSHSFVPLYLSSLTGEICRTFPGIKKSRSGPGAATSAEDDNVVIAVAPSGELTYRSELRDYSLRGPELLDLNFFTFVANTYEVPLTKKDMASDNDGSTVAAATRGRPRHPRSRYLPKHPKATTHLRVTRDPKHNGLPNLIGPWIPRNDRPELYDLYCATILGLLKPWRLLTNLRAEEESWGDAFNTFMRTAGKRERDLVSAAQYYYQCKDAADHDSSALASSPSQDPAPYGEDEEPETTEGDNWADDLMVNCPTEEEIRAYQRSCTRLADLQYAEHAVALGLASGLIKKSNEASWLVTTRRPTLATEEDNNRFLQWKIQMATEARSRRERPARTSLDSAHDTGSVVQAGATNQVALESLGSVTHVPTVEEVIEPVDVGLLKTDQRRTYDVFAAHLDDTLAKRHPPQLLMLVQGEGGTGKSMVISCMAKRFELLGVPDMLLKGAFTGVASSVVDGSTIHTICHLSMAKKQDSLGDKTLHALHKTWKGVTYLIIDEISMISRKFLARISRVLQAAKNAEDPDSTSKPFGGVNVLAFGDFRQFAPVAEGRRAALYWTIDPKDTDNAKIGRELYENFQTVVLLKEQCRTRDDVWLQVLRNIRNGACTPEDIRTIRSLIVSLGDNSGIDGPTEDWSNGVLVTPRNISRIEWNFAANRAHARQNGSRLYICPAEDTVGGNPVTNQQRWDAIRKRSTRAKDRFACNGLPDYVELAIGMKVMVTVNVETELDIANGSRGVVVDIILDRREDEEHACAAAEVRLKYPPECVLVKMDRTKASPIGNLGEGVIPIFPLERRFDIPQQEKALRANRRQLPITSAYAFTDYRSQGQTIPQVIVDIATPPGAGRMTLSNVYVALSRSHGRDSIRLLRDFDDRVLTQPLCDALLVEDAWLERLNRETMEAWEREKRGE